jgi:hypothetical protein
MNQIKLQPAPRQWLENSPLGHSRSAILSTWAVPAMRPAPHVFICAALPISPTGSRPNGSR